MDWPKEWLEPYEAFHEQPRNRVRRRVMYESWPPDLRRQVWYRVSPAVRELMDSWEQALTSHDTNAAPQLQASQPEATSHNWKEGERIGEAKNPGPKGRNRSGNRAPGVRYQEEQAPARRHGSRAAPNPSGNPNTMINQFVGTPGNDGRPGAEDLRPGGLARSPPESVRRSRAGGVPGVRADPQHGVRQHAVNPATKQANSHVADLIRSMEQQLQVLRAEVSRWTAQSTRPIQAAPITDDNPWSVVGSRRRRRRNRRRSHSRGPSADSRPNQDKGPQHQENQHGRRPPQPPRRMPSGGYAPRSGHGPALLPGGSVRQGKPGEAACQRSRPPWSGRVPAPMPGVPPGPPSQGDRAPQRQPPHKPQPQPQRHPPPPYQPRQASPPSSAQATRLPKSQWSKSHQGGAESA